MRSQVKIEQKWAICRCKIE